MSGIEVLIAGIGFCSSIIPYISSFAVKKMLNKKKINKKIINLCLHDFFNFVNSNIVQTKYLYTGNNIYEAIYLSIKYNKINQLFYELIGKIINNNDHDIIIELKKILNMDFNYINFIPLLKENKDLSKLHVEYFINISNFENIYNKIKDYENNFIMTNILNNIKKNIKFKKQKEKYTFLIIFLEFYKSLLKEMIEDIHDEICKEEKQFPKNNILFEIDKSYNIIAYNKAYYHIIDYLTDKILNKNIITDIDIISNKKKFYENHKQKIKIKKSLLDNYYSFDIYLKVINDHKYILLNKNIQNILSSSSQSKKNISPI